MMGYPYSTLRTGATVAVAVKHMTTEGAKRIGLLGTGNNALSLLQGVRHVRAIKEVVIYSRDVERRRNFAAEAAKALDLPVRAAAENREAVSGMDIVLTATNFRQPLFPVDWLDDGCHVSSMGPIGELPEDLFLKASHVVVSCIDHEENYFQPTKPFPLVDLIRDGRMAWDEVDELGSIVTGTAKARRRAGGITVFHESAGGFGDITFASYAYEEAKRRGLGQEIGF
jgi:ornithine cyclodeaminase/alanine dehydrogenase-like protein (mu-crystallin family)